VSDPGIDEAALGQWLEANVQGFIGPFQLSKFPSGQSNPTYKISAGSGEYVMRRKPFGQLLPSAHAVDREYRLLSALHPLGFPVPRPLALCDDPEVIGSIFYIMELARGRPYANGALPEFDPPTRQRIYAQLVDTLADLHSIDPEAAELGDFGKPGNYFERQVMRWTRQYRDSQTDYIPEVERLIAFLPETLPEQSRTSIVHGDYRIDNVVFDGDGTLTAVLDWELAHVGDPAEDLAWMCIPPWRFGELDKPVGGLGMREELLAAHERASGRAIEKARLEWWDVLGSLRWGIMCADMPKWMRSGRDKSVERATISRRASESELDLLRLLAPRRMSG